MRLFIALNFPICLCLILYSDAASVTWYEPLPIKTVSIAGDDSTPAKKELSKGYPASLSWNFSSTSLTVFAVSVMFKSDYLATSGPEGLDTRVEDAFKDRFNFTWISQRFTLTIFNVTAAYDNSNGEFSFELVTSEGGWIRKIQVKIVERPKIVDLTSDRDVCEHSKVILNCNASGNPKPNITWTRVWNNGTDSEALQSTDNNLVMRDIKRSSNGTYRCTAFNGVGNPADQTVEVIVRYSASVVRVVRSLNPVLEGDAYSLSCQVSGDPMPNVTWVKVGNDQSNAGNILNFTNIQRNDSGDFRCQASNRCGTNATTEAITVSFPPETTRNSSRCPVYVKTGHQTKLECHVDGNPPPNITWTLGGKDVEFRSEINVTLKNTGNYTYTCTAFNGIGECIKLTFLYVANHVVAKSFIFMMKEKDSKLTQKLNDDNSKEFQQKNEEVKKKIKAAIPECHKHVVHKIELRPGSINIYFNISFNKLMGKEALTSMFQEALAEGKLGDVDFIGAVRDIPGKKRCGTFYVDDQICDTVKNVPTSSVN